MDPNIVLLQGTLKFMFTFITYKVDAEGLETFGSLRLFKAPFIERIKGEKIRVKLVENYPERFEDNILYVKKDGKTAWYRENSHT